MTSKTRKRWEMEFRINGPSKSPPTAGLPDIRRQPARATPRLTPTGMPAVPYSGNPLNPGSGPIAQPGNTKTITLDPKEFARGQNIRRKFGVAAFEKWLARVARFHPYIRAIQTGIDIVQVMQTASDPVYNLPDRNQAASFINSGSMLIDCDTGVYDLGYGTAYQVWSNTPGGSCGGGTIHVYGHEGWPASVPIIWNDLGTRWKYAALLIGGKNAIQNRIQMGVKITASNYSPIGEPVVEVPMGMTPGRPALYGQMPQLPVSLPKAMRPPKGGLEPANQPAPQPAAHFTRNFGAPPRAVDLRHYAEVPGPRTKELKLKLSGPAKAIARILKGITDGLGGFVDIMDVIYESLPKRFKRGGHQKPQDKFMLAYKAYGNMTEQEYLDFAADLLFNFTLAQLEDKALGEVGNALEYARQTGTPWSQVGFQTGGSNQRYTARIPNL